MIPFNVVYVKLNLEALKIETHIRACEIYRFRKCYNKETNISDIKAHVNKKLYSPIQDTLTDHMKISESN